MLALGTYWCSGIYQGWSEHPVLTTIATAEFPIEEVNMIIN